MPAKGPLAPRFLFVTGIAALAALHVSMARAQFVEPPSANLFGDDFVHKIQMQNGGIVFNSAVANPNHAPNEFEGYEYLLLFQSDRQLHGPVGIGWEGRDHLAAPGLQRADPAEARRGAPRVSQFRQSFTLRRNDWMGRARVTINANILRARSRAWRTNTAVNTDGGIPATLKLRGGDWLFGNVTSEDGQTFDVSLVGEQASVSIPRSQVDWMYFDSESANGGGFDGSMAGMDEWLNAAPSASLGDDGTLSITDDNEWIGRALPQPRRFEVTVDISAETEKGAHLWLQPFGPNPNSFGNGTVDVGLDPKRIELRRFVDQMAQDAINIQDGGKPDAKGMVRYQIFYDSDELRLVIFRNGKNVADTKGKEGNGGARRPMLQVPNYLVRTSARNLFLSGALTAASGALQYPTPAVAASNAYALVASALHARVDAEYLVQRSRMLHPRIMGICLARGFFNGRRSESRLKLRQFQVMPWDGSLPKEGDAAVKQDQLSGGPEGTLFGKLEYIDDKDLQFSLRKFSKTQGLLVKLPRSDSKPFDSNARLNLGAAGEVSASTVEIRDGKARVETAFSAAAEFPISALSTIDFPLHPRKTDEKTDTLVFKNGDELAGKFVAGKPDGAIRWSISAGQEVEVELRKLAGIRFENPAKPPADSATAELRNGDRLRGHINSFDEKLVGIEEPQLGPLSVPRQSLSVLYPEHGSTICEGGDDPSKWMTPPAEGSSFFYGQPNRKGVDFLRSWLYLDGCYLPRQTRAQNGVVNQLFLTASPPKGSSLFEVRAEATGTGGNPPNCGFSIMGKYNENGSTSGIVCNISFAEMYIQVINSRGQKSRQVFLNSKLASLSTRMSLRVFVNSRQGTVDIMLNGAMLAKIGQQADERTPGINQLVQFTGNQYDGHPMVISNLWVGPWSGELPRAGASDAPSTALANGDATASIPTSLENGIFLTESEIGPLHLPATSVAAIDFGGESKPAPHAAARIRLASGSTLHVTRYEFREGTLNCQSEQFGELHIPITNISEIVLDPPPFRPPMGIAVKEQAKPAGEEKPHAEEKANGDGKQTLQGLQINPQLVPPIPGRVIIRE